jgi:hypothetical protein
VRPFFNVSACQQTGPRGRDHPGSPGRHHLGPPGTIILVCPGDIVGIRIRASGTTNIIQIRCLLARTISCDFVRPIERLGIDPISLDEAIDTVSTRPAALVALRDAAQPEQDACGGERRQTPGRPLFPTPPLGIAILRRVLW